eukprot:10979971-Lingulodinium_polyedra.AAC.1
MFVDSFGVAFSRGRVVCEAGALNSQLLSPSSWQPVSRGWRLTMPACGPMGFRRTRAYSTAAVRR